MQEDCAVAPDQSGWVGIVFGEDELRSWLDDIGRIADAVVPVSVGRGNGGFDGVSVWLEAPRGDEGDARSEVNFAKGDVRAFERSISLNVDRTTLVACGEHLLKLAVDCVRHRKDIGRRRHGNRLEVHLALYVMPSVKRDDFGG